MPRSSPSTKDGLPTRSAYHPARKMFHFVTGVLLAAANENVSRPTMITLTLLTFCTALLVETLRVRAPHGKLNAVIIDTFRPFIRAHETRAFAGILYYILGVFLTCTLFPRPASTLGILSLASLDPAAALAGTLFRTRVPAFNMPHGKSMAGLVFATAAAAATLYTAVSAADVSSMSHDDAWMLAVIVAWAAAIVEFMVPSPQVIVGPAQFPVGIDDNALIPVVAAAVANAVLTASFHRLDLAPTIF